MLKINDFECHIKSNTAKFGIYGTGTENLPWYLKNDFEVVPPEGFPLIITVKFEDLLGVGYFQFWIEHVLKNDFNKLANKTFEGTFKLSDYTFKLFEITYDNRFLDSNDVKTNIKIEFGNIENNRILANIRVNSQDFDLLFDDALDMVENSQEDCTVYIPETHKKYDVLPTCRKYNFEMIVWDGNLLKTIEELTCITSHEACPYQRYNSYKDFLDETEKWIKDFPSSKNEIIKYRNSVLKINNKDLWAIVEYIGESNWNFTKNKYYYVVMYVENNTWIIDGIIDNEEYNAFEVWSPKCTNPVDLVNDFKIVIDPSHNLKNEFIKKMNLL